MAADVVQWCVVLVLLSVRRIRVQAVPELRVALVQLPGQGLVAAHQGLTELGGCVAHGFALKGPPKRSCGKFLPAFTADLLLLLFLPRSTQVKT